MLPLLALHGDADKVTSLAAVRRLVAASRSPDKAFVEVGGAFHELLLDTPCKGDVLAQVVAWVNARAAAKAAAASPEAKL